MVQFRMTDAIGPPAGATDSWYMHLYALPGAVCPLISQKYKADGTGGVSTLHLNPQISGTTQPLKCAQWQSLTSAARLVYYGITIFVDTPALYDQGTLVAAQLAQTWQYNYAVQPIKAVYSGPAVNYSTLINMPGAVQWVAREGCYMSLRLFSSALPFKDQETAYDYSGLFVGTLNTSNLPQLLDGNIGAIAMLNLSTNAQVRYTLNFGVELMVPPQSAYSPFLSFPSQPDPVALDSYYAISSKLRDAYPASYNDWNQLWDVIKKVGISMIKSALKSVPVVGGPLVTAGEQIVKLVQSKGSVKPVEVRRVKRVEGKGPVGSPSKGGSNLSITRKKK